LALRRIWHDTGVAGGVLDYTGIESRFCSRAVIVWNSLSNYVVEVDTINILKNRLDKHWRNQEVLLNFNADLTGSGSVPICMTKL